MSLFERLKTVSSFALLFCVIVACNQSGPSGEPTTLKSSDGKFQITVPGGWTAKSPAGGEIIKAANGSGDMDVSVDAISKGSPEDGATIDKIAEAGRNAVANNSSGVTQLESLMVNGSAARQFEARKGNDKCLFTVIETSEHFHTISTCAPVSKYDENKPTLKQITESFRAV